MKKIFIISVLFICACFSSCKEEEKFTTPDYVLKKWSVSTKQLDYRSYSSCEANPVSIPVFREMFRTHYFGDMNVTGMDDYDAEDLKKDPDDMAYNHRLVRFECNQIDRRTNKTIQRIIGDVLFVKFIEGKNKKKGWIMSNRTMTRLNVE